MEKDREVEQLEIRVREFLDVCSELEKEFDENNQDS